MRKYSGTGVALITPFSDGKIDQPALRRIVEHVIAGGVDYIVLLGSTGEAGLLSADEQLQVLRAGVEANDGRVPLVAGNFGSMATQALCQKVSQYSFDGIDAILSSCPSYVKPGQEGLYQHYSQLADCCPIPIILYNIPGRTGVNMLADTTLQLAKNHQNIVGIKEASNDLAQCAQIAKFKADDFLLLSGDDEMTIPIIAMGGQGVISVAANAFPEIFSNMVKAALATHNQQAWSYHQQLMPLYHSLFVEGNPTGIKAAMHILGLCQNELRLPLLSLSPANYALLEKKLRKLKSL